MRPIQNWENVQAAGNREQLPPGGYVCEIKQAVEVKNRNNSGTHLELAVEIIEGEYKGFFERDWRAQTREDKFWAGVVRQNVPDEASNKYEQQCMFFKRFTNTVEDSNPGYHWDWNEVGLKGKKIGVVFGEQERMSQTGRQYTATVAQEIVTVEDIRQGNYKVPEKRLLAGGNTAQSASVGGFAAEDLPF